MAHVVDLEEVWQNRAEEAWNNSLAAYELNPEFVGGTRAGDAERTGPTTGKGLQIVSKVSATEPLVAKRGPIYVVTDPSDKDVVNPRPGTLPHAVIQKGPLWIIFARGMTIRLSQELIMQSDKTIDARGANVNIARGAGITIQFVRNIIIHNLHFNDIVSTNGGMIRDSVDHVGIRQKSDGDSISTFQSSDIWIDHISMSRSADGLIDIVEGSTGITISNCHFADHDKVLLFGADDKNPKDRQ
ncbi:hypothetical protein RJ639_006927 [Escallonia herrerae]|uniref:Pectate lyase n=1 Tax=Escallonia herrerae TaxID=1293975 RepID=A0AA88VX59_9ASTE|nr:hypothetical protein RJ639_006927 [Escallonia herrerae]